MISSFVDTDYHWYNTHEELEMSHLNVKNVRTNRNGATFSLLLIAGIVTTGDAFADSVESALFETQKFVTAQQEQEIVDWNSNAQDALTKHLESRLQGELTSLLDSSGGLGSIQSPGSQVSEQPSLCSGKPVSMGPSGKRMGLGACYAALSR